MPLELEHEIEDMPDEIGQAEIRDDAGASKEAEKPADAQSSGAEDVSKPVDTLSIVRDVVNQKVEPAAASSAEGEAEKPAASAEMKQPDNEAFTDVPFNKHPRFQEVLRQRNEFKENAIRYQNVERYIADQGLNAAEAAELLEIGGLLKTDPVTAWQRIQPTVQKLAIAAGVVLPDELHQLVEAGKVPRDAAMMISRSRAESDALRIRQQFETQQREQRETSQRQQAIQDEVASWQAEREQRDPNFAVKMPALQKEVLWLQKLEGRPASPQAVRAQLQRAYEAIAPIVAAQPQPAPKPKAAIAPLRNGQVSGNARPAPASTLDIVRSVVDRHRAG